MVIDHNMWFTFPLMISQYLSFECNEHHQCFRRLHNILQRWFTGCIWRMHYSCSCPRHHKHIRSRSNSWWKEDSRCLSICLQVQLSPEQESLLDVSLCDHWEAILDYTGLYNVLEQVSSLSSLLTAFYNFQALTSPYCSTQRYSNVIMIMV